MERTEKQPTVKGPVEMFTGDVYFDVIARGEGESRIRVNTVMRPGDTVHTPPGEEHWHGAVADQFMTHLAMWEDDDATWGEHVSDDEYDAAVEPTNEVSE